MPDENESIERYLQYIAHGTLPIDPDADAKAEALDAEIANESRLYKKVELIARRHRLVEPIADADELREGFVKYAGVFSERHRIDYAAWREMGVMPKVLKEAGIAGGPSPRGIAPDDPDRVKPYHRRRFWSPEAKAEYIAFYEDHGREATAARFGDSVKTASMRYYGFKTQARKTAGEPPRGPGRPKKQTTT